MDDELREEIEHRRALSAELIRRLRALELQAARYGADAPPHVQIEIEDLRRQIAVLGRPIGAPEVDATIGAPIALPAAERQGVAVDLSHQQRKWDRFGAFASRPEQRFRAIDQGILAQRAEIERSAVLLVAPPYHCSLERDEIAFVADWVLAGGGLLLMGAYAADQHHMGNPGALARRFGLQFANDLILPAERASELDARVQTRSLNAQLAVKIQLAGSESHPILDGIGELAFLSACSVEIVADLEGASQVLLSAPASSAVLQPRGIIDDDGFMPAIERWELLRHAPAPVLVVTRYGKGRVIAAGSWKLCTLEYGDNAWLVRNILQWLAEPSGP